MPKDGPGNLKFFWSAATTEREHRQLAHLVKSLRPCECSCHHCESPSGKAHEPNVLVCNVCGGLRKT